MIKYILLILTFLLFIINCKNVDYIEIYDSVEIQSYRNNNFIKKELIKITTRSYNESKLFLLGVEKNDSSEVIIDPSIEIFINDKTRIKINGFNSFLISEKNFTLDNKIYKINKYLYNIPEMTDEQSYLYLVNEKLICVSSKYLNSFKFYKYGSLDLTKLLQNDKSGFFNHSKSQHTTKTITNAE